jgi:AraC-like DNA-binding protein
METPDFISKKVLSGDYYFLDLEPDPQKPLTVVCGGRETCGSGYDLHRDTFPYWSIEYVIAGSGRLTIDGISFPIGPGTLFRYGPEIPHSIDVDPGSVLDKAFIDFTGTSTPSWWTGPWKSLRPLHIPAYAGMRSLFDSLLHHGQRGGPHRSRLCALVAEQVAVLALEEAVDADQSHSEAWATYMRCRNEIDARFLSLHTLGDAAKLCHVGEAWLCRLFSRFDTASPYQYLVGRKMAFAASRLADHSVLVKEVASEIGYDPYHFSKAFKKATGFSPEGFRMAVERRAVVSKA